MKCSNCKQIIPDDSEFCHLCGSKISHSAPVYKEPKPQREPMNSKTKKIIIIGVSAFVVIAIALALVFCLIIPINKYNHAKELMENGKYDLAYTEFSELGNFSDAKEKLTETRYLQALEYREKGDYDVANKIFETLGDYRDSKTMIHHHDYKITDSTPKTCTTNGSETRTCSSCNHTYTNTLEASHSYKSVTCTTPKTCSVCGKTEGSALGHSNDLICTRCGASTFKTLEYSGHGVGNVMNVDLPKGKYNFIITHSGQWNFFLDFNDRSIVLETGKVSYVHQYTSSGLNDGYFNITSADGYWTIKIVAVSN